MTTREPVTGGIDQIGVVSAEPIAPPYEAQPESEGRVSQVAGEAQGQASQVAGKTREQASEVASTTQRQASEVVGEAKRQARDLAGETRDQITQQASDQQKRAASSVRQLADGLSRMAEQAPPEAGLAAELARRAADRLHTVGGHLDRREPGELLDDVRSFARQRPGVFLAGALVGGFVTGRLVKGAMSRPPAADRPSETAEAPVTDGPTGEPYARPSGVSAAADGAPYAGSTQPYPAAPAAPVNAGTGTAPLYARTGATGLTVGDGS